MTPRLVEVAYEMAHIYHQDPDVFLAKPLDDLIAHHLETEKLLKRLAPSKG